MATPLDSHIILSSVRIRLSSSCFVSKFVNNTTKQMTFNKIDGIRLHNSCNRRFRTIFRRVLRFVFFLLLCVVFASDSKAFAMPISNKPIHCEKHQLLRIEEITLSFHFMSFSFFLLNSLTLSLTFDERNESECAVESQCNVSRL